jgi:hypothetical protein
MSDPRRWRIKTEANLRASKDSGKEGAKNIIWIMLEERETGWP